MKREREEKFCLISSAASNEFAKFSGEDAFEVLENKCKITLISYRTLPLSSFSSSSLRAAVEQALGKYVRIRDIEIDLNCSIFNRRVAAQISAHSLLLVPDTFNAILGTLGLSSFQVKRERENREK